MQDTDPWRLYGPAQPQHPLVLDSPHSGRVSPPDFGSILDEAAQRSAEDCFVDVLYLPATARVVHINCHSMNAVAGAHGEGGAGNARADFVLGDRDGTTCDPGLTAFVRDALAGMGYDVKVNDPFKGVALVQAYSDPEAGRHSL